MGRADGLPLRVLIVEDDEDMRMLVRTRLQLDGRFAVAGESTNGARAIRDARALQPDIVLLDVMMPVLDGENALPAIRTIAPDAVVVVFSALPVDHPRVARLDAEGHLCKTDLRIVAETLDQAWASRDHRHLAV